MDAFEEFFLIIEESYTPEELRWIIAWTAELDDRFYKARSRSTEPITPAWSRQEA
jgi:hypothetical protein